MMCACAYLRVADVAVAASTRGDRRLLVHRQLVISASVSRDDFRHCEAMVIDFAAIPTRTALSDDGARAGAQFSAFEGRETLALTFGTKLASSGG